MRGEGVLSCPVPVASRSHPFRSLAASPFSLYVGQDPILNLHEVKVWGNSRGRHAYVRNFHPKKEIKFYRL